MGERLAAAIVVRTPLLPLNTFFDWDLARLLADPIVDEALFIASPALHGAIASWRAAPDSPNGQRIERSLVKYVARMVGRATPFGLFSGVSVGTIGRETQLELAPRRAYRRRTRLDNDYLFVLAGALARQHRAKFRYRPNTSIYRIADRLRFAAADLGGVDGKERRYRLVSVVPTPDLDATLARATERDGVQLATLATALVDHEITQAEADAFVDQLVDMQLLVPELGVHITGPEPLDGMLAQLRPAGIAAEIATLDHVRAAIAKLDDTEPEGFVGNAPDRYRAIAGALEVLPAKVDPALLFQVDMLKPGTIVLGQRVVAEVSKVTTRLVETFAFTTNLDAFRTAFVERWEEREIPLAHALDEESGIGFEASRGPGSEGAPLLADLQFPSPPARPTATQSPATAHLFTRLTAALAAGAREIELGDDDFARMKLATPPRLPDAFSARIRLAAGERIDESTTPGRPGPPAILFEGTNGPSGARLLGRFAQISPELEAIVRAHHAAEEALAPDKVFAEIVHLNEGRIGNILCRPVLRAHEIVFLGISGAPREHQITLDDLMVRVRDNRIVLRSRRLDREIVPRLTTAHNFQLRSIGVYRFLCSLAGQGAFNTRFTWGTLAGAPYLPRVCVGRVVLNRATWNLDKAALAGITTAVRAAAKTGERGAVAAAVGALRIACALPRHVVIASGDNELPIDLDNPMLAAAFADELSGSANATVIEMFPTPDRGVVQGPEGTFLGEVEVLFTRTPDATATAPVVRPPSAARSAAGTRRTFAPGSEWLYAKIYCGEATADRVLRDALAPVLREAIASHAIDRWFFVRYTDPESHVRIRCHGEPTALLGAVLPALERAVTPLIDRGAARRLVLDTYDRETERYGGDRGVELVEQIFWHDSEAVLAIVELLDGDAGGDARWRLALRGIESLLETLGLDAPARERCVSRGRESLGREMSADTAFWGRIGDRYTKERASLERLFARDPALDAGDDLEPGFELLAQRDAAIAPLAAELVAREATGELEMPVADMAWSIVHMHANRLLHASQRAQELVLYDFLRRLHGARRSRSKKA